MIAAVSLLFAQLVLPSGEGLSPERKVEILASSITAGSTKPMTLFEDATVRAEMKRVGVDAGCPVVAEVARAAAVRFTEPLTPFAEIAVRETIPAQRLAELSPVSFLIGSVGIYRSRVERKFEEMAAEPLVEARTEAREAALRGLAELPDFVAGPGTAPPIDPFFESAFGARADRVWESAPLMSLACLQRGGRSVSGVTIEHDGQTYRIGEGVQ